jgi:hypothetical protein
VSKNNVITVDEAVVTYEVRPRTGATSRFVAGLHVYVDGNKITDTWGGEYLTEWDAKPKRVARKAKAIAKEWVRRQTVEFREAHTQSGSFVVQVPRQEISR